MFWKRKNKKKKSFRDIKDIKDIREVGDDTIITNYLTDGLLVFDKNSRLFLVNPRAERLLEVRKEKILGKSILELNRFPSFKPLVSLLGGEIRKFFRKELQIRVNFILEITTIPMTAEEKKVGTLVILHNVTREKLADRMKSEFVTLAAHQLRTPSSGVKWSLQILLDGDLGELNEKQRKIVEEAYKANDKMIRMVRDLLNVAQIEEGKYLSKIVLSSIEDIIQSIADSYKKEVEKRKLKFEFKKPKEQFPKLMLDVEKMEIAIKNIFDNALKYTLPGGKVSISLKKDEKEIEVQIQDTGVGIPQEQQRKVFTKFFRGDNAIKIETEGTGLGLFMSKNIIEAHGGRIWFESREGKGSSFYFTIPIKERFGEFLTEKFY